MRRILAKLVGLFRRDRTESELSREVAAHLALLEDEFRGQGMSEEEARLAARRSYGNVELTKEQYRDVWRFAWFEALVQDLRAAWRSLRKSPGFAATAIVTLAFGIGVNTAIFTMVNGVLLKTLPVADPERIVQIKANLSAGHGADRDAVFHLSAVRGTAAAGDGFSGCGWRHFEAVERCNWTANSPGLKLDLVTGSFFSFLDQKPSDGPVDRGVGRRGRRRTGLRSVRIGLAETFPRRRGRLWAGRSRSTPCRFA